MKKLLLMTLIGGLSVAMLTACSPNEIAKDLEGEDIGDISAKIAINIEGVVTEVDESKITLDTGKVVIINDDTAFATQNVGEIVEINDEILVGNFIQGFTQDDTSNDQVTALVISYNGENFAETEDSLSIFTGVISELNDDNAIVVPNDDQEHILSSGDKVSVNLTKYNTEFSVGDEVVVYYSGSIMESYPLKLNVSDIILFEDFDQD